ncbi:lytic transglycosylase domain-containing protein [Streptacidiphilus sp. EB129]|uniref:aggregation-promoting factor C-terminal-like domain-containing protein n=1 Tax=Streptacidiphilus sp. EB129 TaxID=3156262 RepID=UPI003513BE87
MSRKHALPVRKRTAAIIAAASLTGLAVAGVVTDVTAGPAKSVAAQTAVVAKVQDLQTQQAAASASASASAAKAVADKAAAAKAAADKAAAAKAAADKAAAEKAAAAKAAADQAAAAQAAAAQAAANKAAADRAAAAQAAAASRSQVRTAISGSPQEIAAQIVPADQLDSFDQIISHESGWDVTATNASSGAYGLAQALPGDKMASAGADWQTNPATQIRWALDYMNSTYGSPNQAWAFWQAHNWY